MAAITRVLGSAIQSPKNAEISSKWVDSIWSDLKSFLRFLESVLMDAAVKIMCSVAAADKAAGAVLASKGVPVLLQVAKDSGMTLSSSEVDRARVLRLARQLIEASGRSVPMEWLDDAVAVTRATFEDKEESDLEAREEAVRLLMAVSAKADSDVETALTTCFDRGTREKGFLGVPVLKALTVHLMDMKTCRYVS